MNFIPSDLARQSKMVGKRYYLVNGITVYRLIAAPVLILLIITGNVEVFKWLLPLSFFSDLIDGYLARKFKVISIMGAKLDSIADDLTIVAAIVGLFVLKLSFIREEIIWISILLILFLLQTIFALFRYGKLSGFHTYSAKCAAIFQGSFLILIFLLTEPLYILFYFAALLTAIDLVEEIILISLLPKWEANVKGVYWVLKRKRKKKKI